MLVRKTKREKLLETLTEKTTYLFISEFYGTTDKDEDAGPLEGPVFRAPEGFYLRHPTHGDIDCRLPGTYQVSYPIDKAAEEWDEIRRLRD